jgi:putative peptidoglycan lipid II flippase
VVLGAGTCLILPALGGAEGGEKLSLTSRLTALLIPYLVLICVTALFSAVLNVHRRFGAAALGPAVLNLFWLGGLAAAHWGFQGRPSLQIYVVGGALLLGGAAQMVLLLPQMTRFTGWPKPALGFHDPDVRRIGSLAMPVLFGLAVLQINVLVDRLIAEFCVPGNGAVSALYYGNRLVQFPLGIIGIAVSTAAFPLFSRLAARGDLEKMKRVLGGALRGTLFLALPAGVGLILLAVPIIDLLFAHGAFAEDPEATARTLPAAARGFYALQDMRTPTRVAMGTLVVNLTLNLTLVWFLREGGLALATALSATVNLSILLVLLKKKVGVRIVADLLAPAWKGVAASAAMAVAVLALWYGMPILRGEGLSPRFARLTVVIGAGAIVFFTASVLLRDSNLAVLRRRGRTAEGTEDGD